MIHFTESATDVLRRHSPESTDAGFRLIMQKSCSCVQYTLRLEKEMKSNDEVIEIEDGIKLFVDSETFPMVVNTQVDFVEENSQSGFIFDNPNISKSGCASCGSGC